MTFGEQRRDDRPSVLGLVDDAVAARGERELAAARAAAAVGYAAGSLQVHVIHVPLTPQRRVSC